MAVWLFLSLHGTALLIDGVYFVVTGHCVVGHAGLICCLVPLAVCVWLVGAIDMLRSAPTLARRRHSIWRGVLVALAAIWLSADSIGAPRGGAAMALDMFGILVDSVSYWTGWEVTDSLWMGSLWLQLTWAVVFGILRLLGIVGIGGWYNVGCHHWRWHRPTRWIIVWLCGSACALSVSDLLSYTAYHSVSSGRMSPHWWAAGSAVCGATIMTMSLLALWMARLVRRQCNSLLCTHCGYPLVEQVVVGLTRCPECGASGRGTTHSS